MAAEQKEQVFEENSLVRPDLATHDGVAANTPLVVDSPNCQYGDEFIHAQYLYQKNSVEVKDGAIRVVPAGHRYNFRTKRQVPKVGVMLV